MNTIEREEAIKRINTLIKEKLDTLERKYDWGSLDPELVNNIRHTIIRIAFGAYKIGLITDRL